MEKFRPNSVSVSAIFQYPNPIDAAIFRDQLEEQGWFRGRRSRRPPDDSQDSRLVLGDLEISEDMMYQLGVTEGGRIHYSNNTSLPDFGNCAFLTIRSHRHSNIETIVGEAERVFTALNDMDMADQLSTYEVHVDSNVRVNDQQDIDTFLNEESLERIKQIHGETASGQKLTLKSHADHTSPEWYRLSIDLTANMNPLLWGIDYQRRFTSMDAVKEQSIESDVKTTLNESLPSTGHQVQDE